MDSVTRERIVELAMTAPNVDNAQPFYFRWDGDRLQIHRDADRDRRRGNGGYYVSMVGLGCLLECAAIAASGEGLAGEIALTYDLERPAGPWAVVSFAPAAGAPDDLLPGLTVRASDRRLYRGGSLSDEVFEQVRADAAAFEGCNLYFLENPGDDFMAFMQDCEAFLWEDPHILPEILSWLRWNRREVERTRDGMPWQAMGVSYLTSRLMRLVAESRTFRRLARRSGAPLRAQQETLAAQIRSAAALGCFAVPDRRPGRMLQVGRAFLRAWVRLNLAGYGVQVMANAALHTLQAEAGILPGDYPESSKRTFARGRAVLTEAFGCGADEIPAWMFRTGKSPALPGEMRTLRRPVSEVVAS